MTHLPDYPESSPALLAKGYKASLKNGKIHLEIPLQAHFIAEGMQTTGAMTLHQETSNGSTLVINIIREKGNNEVHLVIRNAEEENA